MKKILYLVFVLLLGVLIAACGGGSTPPAASAPAAEAPAAEAPAAEAPAAEAPTSGDVTLSIWTHDQLYLDYFNSRLEEWEALHPDINFTYDFQVDSAAWTNAQNAIAAGEELPDLLGIEQGGFPGFMRDGVIAEYFLPLNDRIGDRRDEYAEGRFSIYSYEGEIYALESSLTASVLYYQPAVFEAAGVEPPATWEEALSVTGPALAANGGALTFATNDGSFFEMYLQQRGGAAFDENGNFVLGEDDNKAKALEVAQLFQDGVANGTFMVVLGGDVWSGATIPTAYTEGKLAGSVMPDWWSTCCLKPGIPDMAGQWAVAKPPVFEGGGADTLVWGGTGFAVSSKSPDAEIAWDFIEFMYMGLDSQVQRFQQINMFPNMLEAAADERVTSLEDPFYDNQRIGEVYAELAPGVPVWYQSQFRGDFRTAVADNLPALFDGSMTPEAFVDELIRYTQDAIDFGS